MDYSVPSSRQGMGLLPHPSRRAGHRLALLTLLGVGLLMFIGQSMAAGGGGGGNLYAFQAGGACDGEKEVCSWAVQEESLADIVVAPAECVSHSILVEKMAPTQAMNACHQ